MFKESKFNFHAPLLNIFTPILFLVFSSGLKAQNSIDQIMERTDLKIDSIEYLANQYFNKVGTGKGTGYKQYQRWLYEHKFHIDNKGYFIAPIVEEKNYQSFASKQKKYKAGAITWSELGPKSWSYTTGWNPGVGRITSLAIHPSDTTKIYVSSPGGGIWKSTNSGGTWTPLMDNISSSWMDVYHICIDPSNQSIIYAGTSSGGVIKSTNAGSTWSAAGSGSSPTKKILVHPSNSNIVFATGGNGIYRSTNGGTSWTRVCTIGMEDIEFNPTNSNLMYASGSSSSGSVWRSTNNGVNWSAVSSSSGITVNGQRTLLAVSPNNSAVVYALQANGSIFGKFYKSTDSGATYSTLITGSATAGTNFFGYESNGTGTTGQAWYDMAICVNRSNVNEVHIAGIICWVSTNGGSSFTAETEWYYPNSRGYNHADVHALEWINGTIYSGSDGGIFKSVDRGDNWINISTGLGIRQIYRIACSKTNANVIVFGSQDNGTAFRQSSGTWKDWLGADGMDCVISPTNAANAIGTSQYGDIYRTTTSGTSISYLSKPATGNWVTPLVIHPTSEDTVFGGWAGVWKSTNKGVNWTSISSSSFSTSLDALALASSDTKHIYAYVGGSTNLLYRTSNGGSSWTSVTPPASITSICVSPSDPKKIWISCNNSTKRIYVSTNMGTSFTDLSTGLPSLSARSVIVDDNSWEGVYVGMNIGVYYRDNTNTTWVLHGSSLPLVAINEVEIQKSSGKLRVATYGRGVWESDLQSGNTCSSPSNLSATNISPSAATLSWSAVTGAVNYVFEYKLASSSTWTGKTTTTSTSINLSSLSSATAYDWHVLTLCSADTSAFVASTFSTTSSCPAPSGLAVASITTSGAALSWSAVTGANNYTVEYKLSTSSAWTNTATSSTTSRTLTGLLLGSVYDWQVRSTCSSGNSVYSQSNFATSCPTPTNASVTNLTPASARVSWNSISGATLYSVEYKLLSSSTWLGADTTSTNFLNISGLSTGFTYNWRVQTSCSPTGSGFLQGSFTTPCSDPSNLSVASVSANGASLAWTINTTVVGYTFEYKAATSSTWIGTTNTSNKFFNLSGLSSGVTYDWRVRSRCTANNSNYIPSSFTTTSSCAAPDTLKSSNLSASGATIIWTSVSGASSYTYEYKLSSSSTWTGTTTSSGNSATISSLTSASGYDWRVQSNCSGGSSAFAQASFSTSCPAPTNLTSSSVSSGGATVSWTAASGATNYTVQYKLASSSTWTSAAPTTSTSLILTSLSAGQTYNWQVQTNCSSGSSSSVQSSFITICPTAAGLSAGNISTSSALLSWTAASGAINYSVDYKLSTASTWIFANSTTSLSLTISGLNPGKAYDWQIRTNCNSDSSSFAQSQFSTTCGVPTNLTSSTITATNVTLNWASVSGATGYSVEYKLASSSTWGGTSNTTSTSITLSSLNSGVVYDWRVKTNCTSNGSSFSQAGFTTLCANPSGLASNNITTNSATISWASVSGASTYTSEYKLSSDTVWIGATTSSAIFKNLSSLNSSSIYDWRIKSNCSVNSSNFYQANFTTLCNLPSNLSTSNLTATSVTLIWTAASGASTYTIEYKLSSASTWIGTSTASTNSFSLSGLSSGLSYDWRVKSNCTLNGSSFVQSTFTTNCPSPINLNSSSITSSSANIAWTAVSGASNYLVEFKLSSSSSWSGTTTTANTSLSLSSLAAGTNYDWRVKANCTANGSSFAQSSFSTSSSCSSPINLASSSISKNGATLSWSAVSGATNYTFEFKLSSSSSWAGATTLTTTSYNLSGLSSGLDYDWRVKTTCTSGSSSYSQGSFSTTCDNPISLAINNIVPRSAAVTWSNVSGAVSYTTEYKLLSASVWTGTKTVSTNRDTFILSPGFTYNWRVSSNCTGGVSAFTQASFTSPCVDITGLTESNISGNSAVISWSAVSGVIGYSYEYKPSTSSTWSGLVNTSSNSINLTGLSSGLSYDWRVRSRCTANNSAFSQSGFSTTSSCSVPGSLSSANISTNGVTLNWSTVSGASGYTIEYKLSTSSSWSGSTTSSTNTLSLTGLTAGSNYDWRVQSNCSGGNSSFVQSNFTTSCPVATGLTTSNLTSNSATVTWSAVSGATSYTVEYKLSTASSWTVASTLSSNSLLISSLLSGSTYDWRLQTNCSTGNSSYSQSSFTTNCANPTGLSSSNITNNSATISWNSITGATSYTIDYKLSSASTWISASSTSSTSMVLTTLTSGASYVWRIQTNCSAGNSSFIQAAFTTNCPTPTNLSSSNLTSSSVNLNWTSASGANSYSIEFKLATDSTWTGTSTSGNSITLSGLSSGLDYDWRIKTNCGSSNSSFVQNAFTTDCPIANNLSVSNILTNSVKIKWSAASGSKSYSYQYKLSSDTIWNNPLNSTDTTQTLSGLSSGASYDWRVKTNCKNINSNFGQSSFTTNCPQCDSIKITNTTSNSANLEWTPAPGVSSYTFEYKTTADTVWSYTSTIYDTTKTLNGLSSGTSYDCRVKSLCLSGGSNFVQNNFTTPCPIAKNASSSNISTSSAFISWDAANGATGYTIEYKEMTSSTWLGFFDTSATNFTLTGLTPSTTYNWRVKTLCRSGNSNYLQASFTTTCGNPGSVTTSSISASGAYLSWSANSGNLSYDVEYKLASSSTWSATANTTSTNFTLNGLTSNSIYDWQVKGRCAANNSNFIQEGFTTLSTCASPSNLSVSNISSSGATLSWSASTGAVTYSVEYKLSSSSTWNALTGITSTTTTISSLSAGSNYDWKVQAICTSGAGSFVQSSFLTACNTPSGLSTTGVSSSGATIKWNSVSGATGYSFEYKLLASSTWTDSGFSTSNSVTLSGLNFGITYVWRVKTNCSANNSSIAQAGFTTLCVEPTGATTNSISNNKATITWNAISGTFGYTVEYKLASTSTWTSIGSISANSYTITGLATATNYDWRVRSRCTANNSNFLQSNFSTSCNPPTNLNVSGLTYNSATINWTAASGVSGYTVEYKLASASNWSGTTTTTSTSFSLSALQAGSNYIFRVKSNCSTAGNFEEINLTTQCIEPSNGVVNISKSNVVKFSWNAVPAVLSYKLERKISTSSTWTTNSISSDTSQNISGLSAGKYDWRVSSNCSLDTVGYLISDFILYCSSSASSANNEYIKHVGLGSISRTSGNDSGYYNGSSLSTSVKPGNQYTVTFAPGFSGTKSNENWNFYIDFNRNGSFSDTGELIVQKQSTDTGKITANFTIPTTASLGLTRMRVSMKNGGYASSPCASFGNGEVEDYSLFITNTPSAPVTVKKVQDEEPLLSVHPIPTQNILNYVYTLNKSCNHINICVSDILGQKVYNKNEDGLEGKYSETLDVSHLSNGIYFLTLTTNNETQVQKFLISR